MSVTFVMNGQTATSTTVTFKSEDSNLRINTWTNANKLHLYPYRTNNIAYVGTIYKLALYTKVSFYSFLLPFPINLGYIFIITIDTIF
jgi:hypothetical protein